MHLELPARTSSWKWWVCGLLLLATMFNYMDRITLNQTADRIKDEFGLTNEQYGLIESVFAVAFALGALGSGWLVDRYNVWWVYPCAVVFWSLAGFTTGFADSLFALMVCRFSLGLFESGNWPCALRTTQRILQPQERTMGNGILQSGASLGAVITPLIVLFFLSEHGTGNWRHPFMVIGAMGLSWVVLWFVSVRRADLALPSWDAKSQAGAAGDKHLSLGPILRDPRLYVLAVMVVSMNAGWHFFRVWLPLFLKEAHGYDDAARNQFSSAYYLCADLGTLAAGYISLRLVRRGFTVHSSRVLVYTGFALLATLSAVAAVLPAGPLLLIVLLLIGFGTLGVFPTYYSLSQELTIRHQGKVTGMLGCTTWLAMALLQWLAGKSIDATNSHSLGVAVAGFMPLVGLLALVFFWKAPPEEVVEFKKESAELAAAPDVAFMERKGT